MNRWKAKRARVAARQRAQTEWRTTFGRLVEATFQPHEVDDVRASAREWIGQRLLWRASWLIGHDDSATYAGQWAWLPERPMPPERGWLGWVPECDITDVVPVEG